MDSGRSRISPADVGFMQGMIHHHARAILMAGWAPTHDAGSAIRELCARIVVAQRDEIEVMIMHHRGEQRRSALAQLAAPIDGYASGAPDATRVRALAAVVKELGGR